jgi:CBS domain-containing protein
MRPVHFSGRGRIAMSRHIVPDIVHDQELTILDPTSTVCDAARRMAERNIGAVFVADHGQLLGIFTERDIAQRVVARGRNPLTVTLDEVMTRHPATVSPDESPSRALEMMHLMGCRHLPVMDGESIVGMLSVRDLYAAIQLELEEDLKLRDEMFMGSGYSVASS